MGWGVPSGGAHKNPGTPYHDPKLNYTTTTNTTSNSYTNQGKKLFYSP